MSGGLIGLSGLIILFVLLIIRIPVAFAMFAVGFAGIWVLRDLNSAMSLLASESFTIASSAELVVVPLFILMGNVASVTGMSARLYDAAYAIVGQIRGGLALATVLGCAGFAALSGSSVASALTMGKVSMDQMNRFDYDNRLSTGVVAAGGTLGILIPPSTGFVIYAILTQQSIGRLFLAGILPGLLLLSMFMLTVVLLCWLMPGFGPRGPKSTMREKGRKMAGALPVLLVVILTIGGIYGGLFSPVEASAVGAGLVILIGVLEGRLGFARFWEAAKSSIVTSATVMLILISAHLINPFLALTHIPTLIGEYLSALDVAPMVVLGLILLTYLVLGCFLEGFAMLVLTMPIFFPVITQLGMDPIWFGVLVVLTLEMGLISPPVGVNVFVVKSVATDVPLGRIFAGVMPFWIAMLVTLAILVAFPQIALILPNTMIE
ncbi:TRAP transporter large permease [Pseudooceanicola spongiae]|jgi:tripartite ATP-independent transporter DctM subunit|uniref:TRAP transporter large permease protein n=1 Tax=Pseudooceanicola spongiae TaxID=2613965 RepID=A0A7L9WI13_9RHOB|nr:TRAP transporter large permease [Pseudooceanicola spongiae]QOL79434.1 TRAP transporter large permease subunit [Pseudooceanicola spongiae]